VIFLGEETIVALDANQLKDLLLTLNDTDISEFTLKEGEFELSIRRGPQQVMVSAPVAAAAPALPLVAAAAPAAVPLAPSTSAPPQENKYTDITSPIVGTFYAAPAPDEANFVQVGDRIQKTQTVCIIEAMKIMNEIEAEVAGEIVEILVQNGQPVEFGQPLMRVKPA
jgi:acetyl-CoA carboxylase biotin carboxyl carrier protein